LKVAGVELPAESVHEPETDVAPESGPLYVTGALHVTLSDRSLPLVLKLTWNEWLYQPLWSAERLGVATAVGPVASYLKLYVADAELPALSVHDPLTDPAEVSGPE
jgi:hypothetical protein